jgi:hypothetical protein
MVLIGSQITRQPGFGFYTSSTYPNQSLLNPTNVDQAVGYNLFTGAVYVIGVILILAGCDERIPKTSELVLLTFVG